MRASYLYIRGIEVIIFVAMIVDFVRYGVALGIRFPYLWPKWNVLNIDFGMLLVSVFVPWELIVSRKAPCGLARFFAAAAASAAMSVAFVGLSRLIANSPSADFWLSDGLFLGTSAFVASGTSSVIERSLARRRGVTDATESGEDGPG